jgi:hypothetical protein
MPGMMNDHAIMEALKYTIPGAPYNTRLAQLGGPIFIQDEYALQQGKFPAVHIEVERQHLRLMSTSLWYGEVRFIISYFDRWEHQFRTIDQIRASIDTDIQVVMSNIQGNPSLVVNGTTNATSVYRIDPSPYKGDIDDKTVPGLKLIKRTLKVYVNVLPYDA